MLVRIVGQAPLSAAVYECGAYWNDFVFEAYVNHCQEAI
jgi:hypothetical protein